MTLSRSTSRRHERQELVALLPAEADIGLDSSGLPAGCTTHRAGPYWAILAAPPPGPGRGKSPAAIRQAVARAALTRQTWLEALMPMGPVLPMAPGTGAPHDLEALALIGRAAIDRAHAQLAAKWQFQVVLDWDRTKAGEHFRHSPPDETSEPIRQWRKDDTATVHHLLHQKSKEAIVGASLGANATVISAHPQTEGANTDLSAHADSSAGPHLSDTALDALAASLADAAYARLGLVAEDLVRLPRDSDTLLNAVLLVRTDRIAEVDEALEEIDAIWSDGVRLRLIGPSPAVSFAMGRIRIVDSDALKEARLTLSIAPEIPLDQTDLARARRSALLAQGGGGKASVDAAYAALLAAQTLAMARSTSADSTDPAATQGLPLLTLHRHGTADPGPTTWSRSA